MDHVVSTFHHPFSSPTHRRRAPRARRRWLAVTVSVTVLAALGPPAGASFAAVAPSGASRAAPRASKAGPWTPLAPSTGVPEAGTPALWENASGHAWVVWQRQAGTDKTYQVAQFAPSGRPAGKPSDVFAGHHWGSLSSQQTLVSHGSSPLLVFNGQSGLANPYNDGCIYGALPGKPSWSLQTWSLSNNCANPVGGAAESKAGVLAAAWPGGWTNGHGVLYRIGTSPSIPAAGSDKHIALPSPAIAAKAGVANDVSGNGHLYVAWARVFSNPSRGDGFYVKDVTAGSKTLKAPGSGQTSANALGVFANVAVTNTNTHRGVYLAYCSNTATCNLRLWRVGAKKALAVPHSRGAGDVAVSAGPAGRVWISWYNESTNKVSVERTNKADTRFGPVTSLRTPCAEHGLIGLTSGQSGRLDIGLQCVNSSKLKLGDFFAQAMVPLNLTPHMATVRSNTTRHLTYRVTDVGNPVKGARVTVAGQTATTNAKGKATITIKAGTKAGRYRVKASSRNYRAGSGSLVVVG